MTRQEFRGSTVTCDVNECLTTITLAGADRAESRGWGIVRIYDGKYDTNCIGDQNGWSNYDLCPAHYREQTEFLGIERVVPEPHSDDYVGELTQ